jgi:hypothetical protein
MTMLDAAPTLPAALTDAAVPSLPDSLLRARAAVEEAARDYLAVPDAAIERQWLWRGHDHGDGVRYGIYRGAETIEAAAADLEAALAGAPARSPAAIRTAPATIARWALQGRMAALDDALLDRVPKPGEWTARQTLAHTIDGQRSYGWFSRWWLSQPLGEGRPSRVTDEAEAASQVELPGEEAEGAGSVADLRGRLDAVLDEWALRYASLDEDALAVPATWAGVPVDIDFRLGRWASHIAEHTIQLDKTLAWLGDQPTEPMRIVRTLYEAWGRLEARIFPVMPEGSDAAVATILDRMGDTLVSEARSARAAAEA